MAERYAQAACETRFHFLTMLLCAAFVGSSLAQEKKLTSAKAKPAFDRADKTLNAAWKESMKTLPESEFNKLKEDQRAWVAHRDYLAIWHVHRCSRVRRVWMIWRWIHRTVW